MLWGKTRKLFGFLSGAENDKKSRIFLVVLFSLLFFGTRLPGLKTDVISPDAVNAQKKFAGRYNLPFQLLTDEGHKVADAYGVWGESSILFIKYTGIIRSSFLIDENGKVIQAWYKVKPLDTVPSAIAALK